MNRSWAYFTPHPHCLLSHEQRWRKQAALLDLTDKAKLRLEWIIFHQTAGKKNATVTARHFGISRSKFYYWLGRFNEQNLRQLEDESPIPKTRRSWQPDPTILRRMITLRNKTKRLWGKMKLKAVYETQYGEPISSWQFQRVIKEFKLYRPRKIKKCQGNGAKKQRVTYAIRQGATWLFQLDTIVLYLGGTKRYILTAVEHSGKLGYAWVTASHGSAAATAFLDRLQFLVNRPITVILTDNGSEFQKHFAKACDAAAIGRYYTKPRTPKDNPECERFNRTIKEEWLSEGGWYTEIKDMNRSLTNWLITYNSIRPHQTLNYQTPLAYSVAHGLLSKRLSSSTVA